MEYTKKEAREWALKNLDGDISTHCTIFKENLEVDLKAMGENFERAIDKFGSDGIWVNGLVGEHTSLTMEEKKDIVELAVAVGKKKKARVIANVSYGYIEETLAMVKQAEAAGCDAVFVCGPTGETLSEDGTYQWYKYIADRVNIGMFMFNTARYHPLGPANIARIVSECPNIVGLKPCPDVFAAATVQALKAAKVGILLFAPFGITGFRSVLEKIIPIEWATSAGSNRFMFNAEGELLAKKCWDMFKKGDWEEAKKLYITKIHPIADLVSYGRMFTWITPHTPLHNVPLWKYWYELMGFHGGPCRLPYTPPTPYQKQDLKEALIGYGVIKG